MWLSDLLEALRKGKELSNSVTWKNRAIGVNALIGVMSALLSVAKGLGYDLGLSSEQVGDVAAGVFGVVAVFNAVVHLATSSRVGLPARS